MRLKPQAKEILNQTEINLNSKEFSKSEELDKSAVLRVGDEIDLGNGRFIQWDPEIDGEFDYEASDRAAEEESMSESIRTTRLY